MDGGGEGGVGGEDTKQAGRRRRPRRTPHLERTSPASHTMQKEQRQTMGGMRLGSCARL
jgi:hypothetical protein